jgi:hypothetical protein
MPDFFVNALKTFTYAFFGTGSDAFDPIDTVPAESARARAGDRRRAEAPEAVRPYAAAAPATPPRRRPFRLRLGLPTSARGGE